MAEGTGQVKPFVRTLPAYLPAGVSRKQCEVPVTLSAQVVSHAHPTTQTYLQLCSHSTGTLLPKLRSSFSCMAAPQSLTMDEKVENQGNVPTQTWNLSF